MVVARLDCQVCGNGLLVFTWGARTGLFLECDECMTAYRDPDDLAQRLRGEDVRETTRPATSDEVVSRGWQRFVWYEAPSQ